MSGPTYVHPDSYVSSPSTSSGPDTALTRPVAAQADMSWVPLAFAMFTLLVATVIVTNTGEVLQFAE